MEGDRELGLLIRIGVPHTLDYKKLRQQPFWQLLERLALRREEGRLVERALFAQTIKDSSRQAFPGKSVNNDMAKMLMELADKKARLYARTILPWLTDKDLSTEEERKNELLGEAATLVEQYLAHFEPHNLPAYQEQMRQQLEAAEQT